MKPNINLTVEGVERAINALKLANKDIGARVRVTVKHTGDIIVRDAKSRVHKRSGELEGTIRDELGEDGLVVYVKAGYGSLKRRSRNRSGKIRRSRLPKLGPVEPGIYAMVEEFGDERRNHLAHPYFFPAIDARLPEHTLELAADLRGAASDAERAV